jgi:hypothetical protein
MQRFWDAQQKPVLDLSVHLMLLPIADCRLPIADCRLQGLPPALDKVGWHSALRRIDPYQFSRKI